MDKFFHRINIDDFETLSLTIVDGNGREVMSGIFPNGAVMTYDTILDLDYEGMYCSIDCASMKYDEGLDVYTVQDGGLTYRILL